eukprot:gene10762-7490_t
MYNGLQSVSIKGSGLSGYVERSRAQTGRSTAAQRRSAADATAGASINPLEVRRARPENDAAAERLALHKARRAAHLDVALYREERLRAGVDAAVVEREAKEMLSSKLAQVEDGLARREAEERQKTAESFASAFDVRPGEAGSAWDYARLQREKQAAELAWRQRKEEQLAETIKRLRTEEDEEAALIPFKCSLLSINLTPLSLSLAVFSTESYSTDSYPSSTRAPVGFTSFARLVHKKPVPLQSIAEPAPRRAIWWLSHPNVFRTHVVAVALGTKRKLFPFRVDSSGTHSSTQQQQQQSFSFLVGFSMGCCQSDDSHAADLDDHDPARRHAAAPAASPACEQRRRHKKTPGGRMKPSSDHTGSPLEGTVGNVFGRDDGGPPPLVEAGLTASAPSPAAAASLTAPQLPPPLPGLGAGESSRRPCAASGAAGRVPTPAAALFSPVDGAAPRGGTTLSLASDFVEQPVDEELLQISDTTASNAAGGRQDELTGASWVDLSQPVPDRVPHYYAPPMRQLSGDMDTFSDLLSGDTTDPRRHRDQVQFSEADARSRLVRSAWLERRQIVSLFAKELFMLERSRLLQSYFLGRSERLLQVTLMVERCHRKQIVRDCAVQLRTWHEEFEATRECLLMMEGPSPLNPHPDPDPSPPRTEVCTVPAPPLEDVDTPPPQRHHRRRPPRQVDGIAESAPPGWPTNGAPRPTTAPGPTPSEHEAFAPHRMRLQGCRSATSAVGPVGIARARRGVGFFYSFLYPIQCAPPSFGGDIIERVLERCSTSVQRTLFYCFRHHHFDVLPLLGDDLLLVKEVRYEFPFLHLTHPLCLFSSQCQPIRSRTRHERQAQRICLLRQKRGHPATCVMASGATYTGRLEAIDPSFNTLLTDCPQAAAPPGAPPSAQRRTLCIIGYTRMAQSREVFMFICVGLFIPLHQITYLLAVCGSSVKEPWYSPCVLSITMRIFVHVREKVIALQCGEGTQEVMWLANAAMVHYDSSFGRRFGPPTAVRKEGGVVCDPNARVCDALRDDQHVFAEVEDPLSS